MLMRGNTYKYTINGLTNNKYYTSFNTKTFSLKSWGKKIKQGLYKSSLNAKFELSSAKY